MINPGHKPVFTTTTLDLTSSPSLYFLSSCYLVTSHLTTSTLHCEFRPETAVVTAVFVTPIGVIQFNIGHHSDVGATGYLNCS